MVSWRFGGCDGETGDSSPLRNSPRHASWTWAANCKFQSTSSTEGLSAGFFSRHLTQISIIVFNDWSEYVLWTAGSTMLRREVLSLLMLACNCIVSGGENEYRLYSVITNLQWKRPEKMNFLFGFYEILVPDLLEDLHHFEFALTSQQWSPVISLQSRKHHFSHLGLSCHVKKKKMRE